jgi:hypothetical protein
MAGIMVAIVVMVAVIGMAIVMVVGVVVPAIVVMIAIVVISVMIRVGVMLVTIVHGAMPFMHVMTPVVCLMIVTMCAIPPFALEIGRVRPAIALAVPADMAVMPAMVAVIFAIVLATIANAAIMPAGRAFAAFMFAAPALAIVPAAPDLAAGVIAMAIAAIVVAAIAAEADFRNRIEWIEQHRIVDRQIVGMRLRCSARAEQHQQRTSENYRGEAESPFAG